MGGVKIEEQVLQQGPDIGPSNAARIGSRSKCYGNDRI